MQVPEGSSKKGKSDESKEIRLDFPFDSQQLHFKAHTNPSTVLHTSAQSPIMMLCDIFVVLTLQPGATNDV